MKKYISKNLNAKLIKPEHHLLQYLPNPDEIAGHNSIEIYTQMMLDSRIASLINLVKTRSLSFPLRLVRADAPDHVFQACRNAGFETEYFDDMEQILSCLIYGYSINECIWAEDTVYWQLKSIEARHPKRFAFNKNFEPVLISQGEELVLNHPYKWIVMRSGAAIENPYGESLLKACYWPWKFKQAGLEFWLKATEKFSVPSILALFETQGTEEEVQKRAQNLANMLGELNSGSGAALANVKQVESLQAAGALADFRSLCEFCDQQISYAITGQSLATGDATYNARAASSTHYDIFYEQAKNVAKQLQSSMQQAVDWFVEINFGVDVQSPKIQFDFGDEIKPSLSEMMQLIQAGIPVDMEHFYHAYGIIPPGIKQ